MDDSPFKGVLKKVSFEIVVKICTNYLWKRYFYHQICSLENTRVLEKTYLVTIVNEFQQLTIATMSSVLDVGRVAGSTSAVFFLFLTTNNTIFYAFELSHKKNIRACEHGSIQVSSKSNQSNRITAILQLTKPNSCWRTNKLKS